MDLHHKILVVTTSELAADVLRQCLAQEGFSQAFFLVVSENAPDDLAQAQQLRDGLAAAAAVVLDEDALTACRPHHAALAAHQTLLIGRANVPINPPPANTSTSVLPAAPRQLAKKILAKPVSPRALSDVLYQWLQPKVPWVLAPWLFVPRSRTLTREGRPPRLLTEREDAILSLLCEQSAHEAQNTSPYQTPLPNAPDGLTSQDIRQALWGRGVDGQALGNAQTLATHMARLRKKIAPTTIPCLQQRYRLVPAARRAKPS